MQRWSRFVLVMGLGLGAFACGDNSSGEDSYEVGVEPDELDGGKPQGKLEIFSWWMSPGEVEALQALVDLNKRKHPGVTIVNGALYLEDARTELERRLNDDNPPDLFQDSAVTLPARVRAHPNKFQPLDDLFDQTGLRESVPQEIIDTLTIDGHIYGIPVNVHRLHVLYTNSALFAAHGLKPPTSQEELLEVCAKLKAAGVTPISVWGGARGVDGLFHALAWSALGAESYRDYFTGKLSADSPSLTAAIDLFSAVYGEYTNPESQDPNFPYEASLKLLFDHKAAMRFEGDWATGYYRQLGWDPAIDFNLQGPPGAEDGFEYVIDVFALPVGAPHEALARLFLETLASPEGQIAFNNIKGSSPVRTDVDQEKLVPIVRLGLNNFMNAKVYTSFRTREEWFPAFEVFQVDGDKEKLREALIQYPPLP